MVKSRVFLASLFAVTFFFGCQQPSLPEVGSESVHPSTVPDEDAALLARIEAEVAKLYPMQNASARYATPVAGVNPSQEEIIDFMGYVAEVYQVPTEILFSIAKGESGLRQFYGDGSPIVSGDDGIGMMQVTPWAVSGNFDRNQLLYNWQYNVEAGAQVILTKWKYVLGRNPIGNMDWRVLENWYLALWAYNGYSYINNPNEYIYGPRTWNNGSVSWTIAKPYQGKILDYLEAGFGTRVTALPATQMPPYGSRPGIPYSGQTFATPTPEHYTLADAPSDFEKVEGLLSDIAAGGGKVWGVNAAGNVYERDQRGWNQIYGTLARLTIDSDGTVWGINPAGSIYFMEAGQWHHVPGSLSDIGANAGEVYGVNAQGNIYHYLGEGQWAQVPAPFSAAAVDVDDGDPWVAAADGRIFCFDTVGHWYQVAGALTDIAYGDGHAWGVNAAGNVYRYEGYGQWTQLRAPFRASRLDVDSDGIAWVTATDGRIYKLAQEANP